jgi:hypothetical protein
VLVVTHARYPVSSPRRRIEDGRIVRKRGPRARVKEG